MTGISTTDRHYRIHVVRNDGRHVVMTPHLMLHSEACTVQSKLNPRTARDCIFVEGELHPCVGHDEANARGRGEKRYCLECLEEIAETAAKVAQRVQERARLTRTNF